MNKVKLSAQGSFENIFNEKECGRISSVVMEFDSTILPKIIDSTQNFWEDEFEFRLFDINKHEKVKEDSYLAKDAFFTSQVPSTVTPPVTMRLSDEFVRLFLHNTFGSNSPEFKLVDLSELEIKILNSYCDFMYKSFADILIEPEKLNKFELKNKEVYNFVVVVKNKDDKNSKIVISLPYIRINKKETEKKENFTEEEFKNLSVTPDVEAGSSKITLNDLQNIAEGDIILLENSSVNKMKIITSSTEKEFKVNPDPRLVIELDEEEHDMDREENTSKNMWDDIQIEVSARFKKVKMTLGELKHISKGLVIDLGSIFNNEISLLVEDKTVAKGELVIINDKYAVKINEIISEEANKEKPKAQSPAAETKTQQAPAAQKAQAAHGAQQTAQRPQQTARPQAQRAQQAARPQAQRPQQAAPRPQQAARPQAQRPAKSEVEEDFDYSDFEEEK